MSESENIVAFPDLREIEEEAAVWVARFEVRPVSPKLKGDLQRWIDQGPQYREAFERMTTLWGGADVLDELNYLDTDETGSHSRWWYSNPGRWAGLAASFVIVAGILFWLMSNTGDPVQDARFATAVGSQETVHLVDGSEVILNTDSAIDVSITDSSRRVELLRGEAYFSVAPDRKKPFRVVAGERLVRAVGTAFTVRLREKDVEVAVTEGSVELYSKQEETAGGNEKSRDATRSDRPPLGLLTAGQNAVFAEKIERLDHMSETDLRQKLLWRNGFIAFAGEPLSQVVEEISRYTELKIIIADPQLQEVPIGGYFKVGDVEGLFEALQNVFDVKVSRIDFHTVHLTRSS